MKIDEGLIAAAQRACTGANVHDINAKLSSYRGWVEIATDKPTPTNTRTAEAHATSLRMLLAKITTLGQPGGKK